MKRMMFFLAVVSVIVLVHCVDLLAVPADGRPGKFTQPDGTTFMGRVFGHEFQMWVETIEGYTIVKNYDDGFWYYVELGSNGHFIPSTLRVGEADPALFGFSKHLREPEPVKEKPHEGREAISAGERMSTAMLGDVKLGVILIEFPDVKGGYSNVVQGRHYTKTDFWNMMYGDNYVSPGFHTPDDEEVFGSVKAYFHEISYGAVNLTGVYGDERDILNPDDNGDGIPEWYECSINKYPLDCWISGDVCNHYFYTRKLRPKRMHMDSLLMPMIRYALSLQENLSSTTRFFGHRLKVLAGVGISPRNGLVITMKMI